MQTRLTLLVCLLIACSSNSALPDAMPDAPVTPPSGLDPAKSLIITSRVGFRDVADPASGLTLGKLLAARHAFMDAKRVADGRASEPPRDGTLMAFTKLAEDVDQHNGLPCRRRIGLVKYTTNPFRDRILAHWDPDGTGPDLPAGDQDGPFRLLAVINRLDVAGADDNPGGGATLPEDKRKFFGEGRLVFGLTTPGDDGAPYPMTLIMEYHLPFLRTSIVDGVTTFVADRTDFNHDAIGDADWVEQRAIWAGLWAELSRYDLDSDAYRTKLREIVSLFARPENSVALRVGYIVERKDSLDPEQHCDAPPDPIREFEYRESYTQGGFLLAPRDLARDVHPCVAQQPFFAELVEQRWQPATRDMRFDYKWPSAIQDQAAIFAACGLPMGAEQDAQGPRVHVSRFLVDKWWPALYGTDPDDHTVNNMEEKRHDFAMTTCSGCHSRETGTAGFMIFPRRADEDSVLTELLRGPVSVTLPNGAQYHYDELARRATLIEAFAQKSYPCTGSLCPAPPAQATSMQEEMLRK
jgi:hypothetical protein